MTTYSLQRRLLITVFGASALLWLVSVAIMISVAWDETSDLFDNALKEAAHLIIAASAGTAMQNTAPVSPFAVQQRVATHYQIINAGQVIRRSAAAPTTPFATGGRNDEDGYVDNGPWRVYVLADVDRGFEVQVAQQTASRLEILQELAEDLTLPALGLLLLLAGVSWLAIWLLLLPLQAAAHAIAEKSPDDLTPMSSANLPTELLPIMTALNKLLARLDSALSAERRFTADAAHELRTPLAALRNQVQLMQRRQPEQHTSLQKVRDDIDRLTTLVEQLLALARLDYHEPHRDAMSLVPLIPLLDEVCMTLGPAAAAREITLHCACMDEQVRGDITLLRIALRNLVENAIYHCPPGSRVRVEAWTTPARIELAVRDNGPGAPPSERGRLADRFYRSLGAEHSGSGLGLSIVKRIAERHSANLVFEDGLEGAGLTARLSFPRVESQ